MLKKYDYDVILVILRKYAGQYSGIKKAYTEISQLKGYESIALGTISDIARFNGVTFKRGRERKYNIDIKALKEDIDKKANIKDLAIKYGVDIGIIYRLLRENGTPKKQLTVKEEIIQVLKNSNSPLTVREIAELLNKDIDFQYLVNYVNRVISKDKDFKRINRKKARASVYTLVDNHE